MLCEITEKRINCNKHEETTLSQCDSLIAVHGDKQLHIIDFSYNLQCLENRLDLVEMVIPCPKHNVTSNYLTNYVQNGVRNMEMVDIITDPYMWPYSSQLQKETNNIASFQFSPYSFVHNKSALAVLNRVGHLELYAFLNRDWSCVIELSSIIKEYFKIKHNINRKQKSLEELRNVVYKISTSTVCWAPIANPDGSCYFVTAQRSGHIMIWQLKYDEPINDDNVVVIFEVDCVEINCIQWIPNNEDSFLLVYANVLGGVHGTVFKTNNKTFIKDQDVKLWTYKDKMAVKSLIYTNVDKKTVIVFSKHRHVVVQLYDNDFKLLSQYVSNLNDNRISSITKAKYGIYVATINAKIYKANFMVDNDEISANYELILLKESYPNCDLHGLTFSNNDVLCSLVFLNRDVLHRKVQQKLYLSICCFEDDYKSEDLLLCSNPSNKFTHIWDSIEFLRYKTIKRRKLPNVDYNLLYREGETDLYKLKVYLIIVKLYHSLENVSNNNSKDLLPETSAEVVKEKILAKHASNFVSNIHEKYKKHKLLNEFDTACLSRCVKFLEFYCQKYNRTVSEFLDSEVLKLCFNRNCSCQFCDSVINDFVGECGHLNMFCSLSFRHIEEMEYLKCKNCNSTARADLLQYEPLCVFCDLYLVIN